MIAAAAVAFVLGRVIRDMIRRRPVREKKARRRGVTRFFAATALVIAIGLTLGVAAFGAVTALAGDIQPDVAALELLVVAFGAYVARELVRFLRRK